MAFLLSTILTQFCDLKITHEKEQFFFIFALTCLSMKYILQVHIHVLDVTYKSQNVYNV